MIFNHTRDCPVFDGRRHGVAFPYANRFNYVRFNYLECCDFSIVFVDPVPDRQVSARMYATADYQDCCCGGNEGGAYTEAGRLLKRFLPESELVLECGCGTGALLKALGAEGIEPIGVEFDEGEADIAGRNAGCSALSIDDFLAQADKPKFDATNLGDVLDHWLYLGPTLKQLFENLKLDGVVVTAGPLAGNPSLLYWAARLFGTIKHRFRPDFIAGHAPIQFFRNNAEQQLALFSRVEQYFHLKYWNVYEAGWRYANGSLIKRNITSCAEVLIGKQLLGGVWHKLRDVFAYQSSSDAGVPAGPVR